MRRSLLLGSLALGMASPAGAAGSDLDSLRLGRLVCGPSVTPDRLKGNVVLVEFWGVHCGPCVKSMPALAAFEKAHRGQPLKVIGIEFKNGADSDIQRLVQANGVEYTVVSGGDYPKAFSGIPHAFVFDHTGRMVFNGLPDAAEKAAAAAFAAIPDLWFPPDASFTRLKPLADQALARRDLGRLLTVLRAKGQSADETERAEAKALLQAVEGYAARRKGIPRDEDPEQYLEALDALSREFAGDAMGDDAKALKDREAADPAFQKLRAGFKALAVQKRILEADLTPCRFCRVRTQGAGSESCPECLKVNAETVGSVKKALSGIQEEFSGTAAAARAAELAARL